ncbi:MarR family winged helix-turn-helix transcriptional regulator [Azospirillum thermophilum]|uniref:MarR family transcriptional regulator n=1 Tax=Azospirillum thermophilum TaxID=2202148 RepID=A0A2S2CM64_9PROT|nr:MarR family transcriptional regulator [Azospirillum thermophilum]AWK85562.1 MarR family transcriptional regulator [Azospirillum thermophilum]
MPPSSPEPNAADAFTELVLEVFRLNGRLLLAGDRLSAPVGLTSARWQILGALADGPATVAQIARSMGLTRQSVQRLADVLSGEGITAFIPNPHHKRSSLVTLTAKGQDMLDRVTALQREWAEQTSAGLSGRMLADAADLLKILRQRLEIASGDDAPNER